MAIKKRFDLFDYNCDLDLRIVWLGSQMVSVSGSESGTDASLAAQAVKAITLLDRLAPNGDKPIEILLNQPGGDEFHCAAIVDVIRQAKNFTTIKGYGMLMSAGSIIFQASKQRLMAPSSVMMIHYGSWGYNDHPKIMYNWAEQGKKMDTWMEKIYLDRIREKHPDFKLEDLQKMLDFDTFFSAEEAVAIGLADGIIE